MPLILKTLSAEIRGWHTGAQHPFRGWSIFIYDSGSASKVEALSIGLRSIAPNSSNLKPKAAVTHWKL